MRLERWVLPPAIATAVFTTMAIVPPGGAPAVGLRVETLGRASPGRPLPVRVAIDAAGGPRWHAPDRADFTLRGAHTASHAHATIAVHEIPYLSAVLPPIDEPAQDLIVQAGSFEARARLRSGLLAEPVRSEPRGAEAGIAVAVEGGALVPEVPGTLLVRSGYADQDEVSVAGADESVEITPPRARLDLCRVAAFTITVRGSDAHVVVTVPGGPDRQVHRRLAVTPGGLALHASGDSVEATAPIGDQNVYFVAGDPMGPTWWSAMRLPDAPDTNASVRVVPPVGAAWIFASFSLALDVGAGEWLASPPDARCPHTPLGERWSDLATPLPPIPPIDLVFDGASIAARARVDRQRRARWLAGILAAASLMMLVALVIAAGLQRDPEALKDVSATTRQRLRIALLGTVALLVGGFVLLYTLILRV